MGSESQPIAQVVDIVAKPARLDLSGTLNHGTLFSTHARQQSRLDATIRPSSVAKLGFSDYTCITLRASKIEFLSHTWIMIRTNRA